MLTVFGILPLFLRSCLYLNAIKVNFVVLGFYVFLCVVTQYIALTILFDISVRCQTINCMHKHIKLVRQE
jgi:hypothetical protein